MMSDGIIPRLVAGYGLPEHLRITIGTDEEVKAVLRSLSAFVAGK
jgi:histidinol-phosphate aminotransferase